jgi:hypothetical protein
MTAPNPLQRVWIALYACFEKLARFSPWDIEVGALRQTPLDYRHNLPSWNAPVVRTLRAGSQVDRIESNCR